jgi:hypothetical protein
MFAQSLFRLEILSEVDHSCSPLKSPGLLLVHSLLIQEVFAKVGKASLEVIRAGINGIHNSFIIIGVRTFLRQKFRSDSFCSPGPRMTPTMTHIALVNKKQ